MCNSAFGRRYDLKRHEQTVHGGEESDIEESDGSEIDDHQTPTAEHSDFENDKQDETSDSELSSHEMEDNIAYQTWYEQALEDTQEMRNEKYQKYVSTGMDEDQAREKAHVKTLWAVKRIFFDHLKTFIGLSIHLGPDDTFQEIMNDVDVMVDKGLPLRPTLKRVVARYQSQFDSLFQYDDGESDEESEEMEEDEES